MTDASSIHEEASHFAAAVEIEQLDATAARAAVPQLVTVLRDVVAHGASVASWQISLTSAPRRTGAV
jgi:hypothetical protein